MPVVTLVGDDVKSADRRQQVCYDGSVQSMEITRRVRECRPSSATPELMLCLE